MNTFKNCTSCGKLIANNFSSICQQCMAMEESDFKIVREYIYDHDDANIIEVSEATGVTTQKILRFLKEERLIMNIAEGGMTLSCESCGTAIPTGRYCLKCKKELETSLKRVSNSAVKKSETLKTTKKEKDRMFTAFMRK